MLMTTPNYDSSNIRTLSTLEDFRINSSQYVGTGGVDTDVQLAKEIIDNAADESIDPNKTYNIKVVVFTNGKRYQFCVVDHGRGIPCDKLEAVYTKRSTSGKYDTKAYNGLTVGTWGVGSKLVAALSDVFVSITKRNDGFAGIRFERGIVMKYDTTKPLDKNESTNGTTVIYETDRSIVKESDLYISNDNGLAETLKLIDFISAVKPNTKFTVYRVNTLLSKDWYLKPFSEQWNYLQEITGSVIYTSPATFSLFSFSKNQYGITDKTVWSLELKRIIDVTNDSDRMGYIIHIGLTAKPDKQNGLVGVVNGNPISNPKSSHLTVLQQVLKKQLMQYIDEDNRALQTFFETQYTIPLHGFVQIYYKNAKFVSQTKTSFENVDFARMYGQSLTQNIESVKHTQWETMFDLIADDIADKFEAANNKAFNTGKSLKNAAFKLSRIGSYTPCAINSPDITELLVSEGTSAGGSIKIVRNPEFQAVLTLKGKPPNIIKQEDMLTTNAVCMDLMRLCGVGPRDTNLNNFNFKSIGLLADADPDGYHIICLVIGCLMKINPLILSSGRVWIATPPLYVYATKQNPSLYMRDQKALDDTRVNIYKEYFDFKILNLKNGCTVELKNDAYRDFVYLVKRVGAVIKDVSTKLAINPFILEQLTHVVKYLSLSNLDCDKIKATLELDRCEYSRMANTLLMVSDGAEISIPMDNLVEEINRYIMPEVAPAHWGVIQPLVTTRMTDVYKDEPLAFMQIDKIFDEVDNIYKVRRLKGLGETEHDQLAYSCIDPATRTYATIHDIGDVDRLFKVLGVDPTWRKELAKTKLETVLQGGGKI